MASWPFSDMKVPEACFRGAKDLAELTQSLPGPFAAPAFLHRMIKLVKKTVPVSVQLVDAVGGTDLEWRRSWTSELKLDGLADICPFLFALLKSVEVGGSDAWVPAFEHTSGLPAKSKLPPALLALQVYEEALLLRALQRQ